MILPWSHNTWFLPFLSHLPDTTQIDVWGSFLNSGGTSRAFPYGFLYILTFAPLTFIGQHIGGLFGAKIGLGITVIIIDILLLKSFKKLTSDRVGKYLNLYFWLSPITIYISYWHGQLDVLPTLLLVLSLLAIKKYKYILSALFLALAVSAKLSMIVAFPLILIYTFGLASGRKIVLKYFSITLLALTLLIGPFILLSGYREMVLGTPELQKSFALSIKYNESLNLYILPIAYAALLLVAWRIKRISFEGLLSMIGFAFLSLYILTPAAPGWAMWFVGFLAIHIIKSGSRAKILYLFVNLLFVLFHSITSSGSEFIVGPDWNFNELRELLPELSLGEPESWTFSFLVVILATLGLQMLRERIFSNNFHLSTRKPLFIGISGDSGVGKDTLSDLICDIFGTNNTCTISGDDYHSWDRHKPLWRALTHLNPKANELERFENDALELSRGRTIRSAHYDHSIGRMTKPRLINSKNTVIVSGLHALFSKKLTDKYDLSIFLDMDEGLRQYLKVRRDVSYRGHTIEKVIESIKSRHADGLKFIQPQKKNADLIISLGPTKANDVKDYNKLPSDIPLSLKITTQNGNTFDNLKIYLISLCGLNVMDELTDDGNTQIIIEGTPSSENIKVVASKLYREMHEHISHIPKWHGKQSGLLQLIILDQLNEARRSFGGTV